MPHILDISPAALDEQILKDLGFSTPSDFEVIADALNPTEQRILYTRYMEILQDAQRQVRVGVRHTGVMNSDTDWVTDYRIKPPTLKEFIEEPKWLGQTLMPSDDSPGLFPAWRHLILRDFEFGSSIHNLVVTGSLGIGKCWKSGTYMILFNGTLKKVEDIVAGDTLMGDDSTPRTVTSTVKGHGEMYQIYPVQGDPFTVNGDHILVLKSTISEEIVEVTVNDFLAWDTPRRHKACLYREPVDWCEKEVVLDPYWLGLWLGDGHSRQIALTSMDEPLVSYWNNYCKLQGLEIREYSAGKGAKARTYNAVKVGDKGQQQPGKNPLRNKLRELGLCLGDGTTSKFIPQCYLANSRRIRLHLLAGLIDTDGHKCATGNEGTYEITVKQKLFSDQIRFLSQSLGYRAATRIKVVNSTAYFRTTISGAYDIPVLLDRKKSGIKRKRFSNLTGEAFDYGSLKSRFAVIPVGKDDYYGFTLNGNQRCLLGDFTVTHNTFVMVALLLYRLTLATLLKNPQSFFGLSQGSKIVYNILSVTKSQVQETAFGDAINFMSRSDYFVNDCNFDPDSKYSNFRIELPGDIYFTAGSKGWHVLGRNVLGVALDEGNWRNEADPDTTAYDLYNEVRVRIANRFMRTAKFLPAISILASSARDESSFTEQVIKEIAAAKDPEHQIVYRNAVYKIKRAALNLEGSKWFKVCYGLKTMEPYVLQGLYMEDGTPVECGEQHEKALSGASVEMVPERYLQEFRRRTRVALQSISGISTGGSNRFFSSTIDLMRCIELSVSEGVVNPCRQGVTSLAVSMEDNVQVWDYLDHNKFLTIIQSRIQPKRHPEMARFAHLDLATQTVAGLSICHLVGNKLVTGLSDAQGNPFQEYRLIVEYDFILTIIAGRIKPISLEKIQNFIFWLRDKCGFRFLKITADQYQSAMPLQMLESRSIPAENLSVDRDNKVYTAWRQASEELRLRMYRQDTMMHEAENLLYVDGNKKVDHPKDGSKDTCLSQSTKVRLLDGRVIQIGQLEAGSKFWVYSIDQGGRVKATEAVALGITRKKAAVVRVVLDNEKDVICTPDHLFMLRDGTYRPACDLRPNDSLMPFYFRQAVAQLRQHQVEQVEVLRQEGSSLREACRQTGVSFYIYKTWRKKLNHKVVSVVDSGIEDVTCLSTDIGNFALEAGVFVHNSDSAAGAYFNAIMSEEKLSIAVDNNPSIIGNQSLTDKTFERPPVEIPLPMGYMKIKSFS